MTYDILRLRDAIDSLAVTYPDDEKAAELQRSFSDWWNHERPYLPNEGDAWKADADDFYSVYLTTFTRLLVSAENTPRTPPEELSLVVHAGVHLGFTSTEHGSLDLPFFLHFAAKSFLDLVASTARQKG